MTIFDYFTKAIGSRYWQTRLAFYTEFNHNVIDNLLAYGHAGRVLSAGDMKRQLRQKTLDRYREIVTGETPSGLPVTTNWSLTDFADRWLNNVRGVAQFNQALTEAGYSGGSYVVEQDAELARQLGYRANEYLFKLKA